MADWVRDSLYILAAVFLVLLNGFFVAAEFALVTIRRSRVDDLVRQGRPFAGTARWLVKRLDASLSACQIDVTMASLSLGWIGEPAFARLLAPLFHAVGLTSPAVLHTVSFVVAFTLIAALHIVIGEQAPKIYAIRRPESMLLWCAVPMRLAYILLFPLLMALKGATEMLLRRAGIDSATEHEVHHSEEEIRMMLAQAHAHGDLTRSEHRLLHAVFEFDDLVARCVMVPRADIVYFDVNRTITECIELARRTKHTRYPVCDGSLDQVLGIAHIKDLVGVSGEKPFDLRTILRPPRRVPETMSVSRLLRQFQSTHELMALVVDEHGTLVGAVSLENVLEEIVGPVEDEFDTEPKAIVEEGERRFVVLGNTPIETVNRKLGLNLREPDVDTLSGLLMTREDRILEVGDQLELEGATAEVLEMDGTRARSIRITVAEKPEEEPGG